MMRLTTSWKISISISTAGELEEAVQCLLWPSGKKACIHSTFGAPGYQLPLPPAPPHRLSNIEFHWRIQQRMSLTPMQNNNSAAIYLQGRMLFLTVMPCNDNFQCFHWIPFITLTRNTPGIYHLSSPCLDKTFHTFALIWRQSTRMPVCSRSARECHVNKILATYVQKSAVQIYRGKSIIDCYIYMCKCYICLA